jgi:hypothetical protein
MAIEKIWLYPPLAFARVGGSSQPLEAFFWGPNDLSAAGTGQTTILPAETLRIEADDTLSAYIPDRILFKDREGFRPVCPFYELHGVWDEGTRTEGLITTEVLARHGCSISDLEWTVEAANLKAYFMSGDPGAKVQARLSLRGDRAGRHELEAGSPSDAAEPLIPRHRTIRLGSVHVIRPSEEFPEVRLRFIPGQGKFYGPTDLLRRWDVSLPRENLILNPDSPWCRWKPTPPDPRGEPGGQYAQDENAVSYGMIDDVCDGIISCSIGKLGLKTWARVVSCPPDYAPDRRHLISIADGLKDRTSRDEVAKDAYFEDKDLCDLEILDLMERVFETVSLTNVDVLNSRSHTENAEFARDLGDTAQNPDKSAFAVEPPIKDVPLPLTERARSFHRRLANITVLKDILRKDPQLFDKAVRSPFDTSPYYNRKMPLGMRGAAGSPLALTPRQYSFFQGWIARLHRDDSPAVEDKS